MLQTGLTIDTTRWRRRDAENNDPKACKFDGKNIVDERRCNHDTHPR
jgi:hypothetical protein